MNWLVSVITFSRWLWEGVEKNASRSIVFKGSSVGPSLHTEELPEIGGEIRMEEETVCTVLSGFPLELIKIKLCCVQAVRKTAHCLKIAILLFTAQIFLTLTVVMERRGLKHKNMRGVSNKHQLISLSCSFREKYSSVNTAVRSIVCIGKGKLTIFDDVAKCPAEKVT